jgi:hypothetical protein
MISWYLHGALPRDVQNGIQIRLTRISEHFFGSAPVISTMMAYRIPPNSISTTAEDLIRGLTAGGLLPPMADEYNEEPFGLTYARNYAFESGNLGFVRSQYI